jgi:hypothetical protein
MERFKWFDYLGALLLLFSVTKSAITPQVSADSSDVDTIPSTSADQVADSSQHLFEQASDVRVERPNLWAKPLLEEGSISPGSKGEADRGIGEGKGWEQPLSSIEPMQCAYVWKDTMGVESPVQFELF